MYSSTSTAMLQRQEKAERRAIARAEARGDDAAARRARRAFVAVCREMDYRAARGR